MFNYSKIVNIVMNAKFLSSVSSLLILLAWATHVSAQNVLLFTFDDSGPNLTATVTGSFDTSGLRPSQQTGPIDPPGLFTSQFSIHSFGLTTATRIDHFAGAITPSRIVNGVEIFPLLLVAPRQIITPLSEHLEITAFVDEQIPAEIGLAEGKTTFNADALTNNIIVFQSNLLTLFGSNSTLSTTPTTVLSDPGEGNIIQFVLATPTIVLGDVNQDDVVNFLDISPFIGFLSIGGFLEEADVNQDGAVNFWDITPFIQILSGT